jgi:hypothetical protein
MTAKTFLSIWDHRRIQVLHPRNIASPITHVASLAQSTVSHPRRRASPEQVSESSLRVLHQRDRRSFTNGTNDEYTVLPHVA